MHGRLGRDLGINGVWGNFGAASASGVTALIAATLGWRAAFILPGLVCLAVGAPFWRWCRAMATRSAARRTRGDDPRVAALALLGIFAAAVVAGGMTFNVTTIALPKVIDERLGLDLPLMLIGSLATLVFVFGALMQLFMGRLVDRFTLPAIFVGLSLLQPLGPRPCRSDDAACPCCSASCSRWQSIYGQVVVNDAMVARYVPARHRAKAFSVRYFLGFTVSGLAVPLIALLHTKGGFPLVLGAAAAFGMAIWLAAVAFLALASAPRREDVIPAE